MTARAQESRRCRASCSSAARSRRATRSTSSPSRPGATSSSHRWETRRWSREGSRTSRRRCTPRVLPTSASPRSLVTARGWCSRCGPARRRAITSGCSTSGRARLGSSPSGTSGCPAADWRRIEIPPGGRTTRYGSRRRARGTWPTRGGCSTPRSTRSILRPVRCGDGPIPLTSSASPCSSTSVTRPAARSRSARCATRSLTRHEPTCSVSLRA